MDSDAPVAVEKPVSHHEEALQAKKPHEVAERGQTATDKYVLSGHCPQISCLSSFRYGRPLVQFDPAAEARLRLKIDLYIVPTISLLYLFCYIDRSNIGIYPPVRIIVQSLYRRGK